MSQKIATVIPPDTQFKRVPLTRDAVVIGQAQWDVIERANQGGQVMAASEAERMALNRLYARGLVTKNHFGNHYLGPTTIYTLLPALTSSWLVILECRSSTRRSSTGRRTASRIPSRSSWSGRGCAPRATCTGGCSAAR